jgi:hypothetical protein
MLSELTVSAGGPEVDGMGCKVNKPLVKVGQGLFVWDVK